jgi:acyl-coenzyme A thioesterase PaaI-like protein
MNDVAYGAHDPAKAVRAEAPVFHPDCFACGADNGNGMHLKFVTSGTRCTGTVALKTQFQGYDGIAQGGIVATILDSAMVWLLHDLFGGNPLTGRLNIRYLGKTPLHAPLEINARFIDRRGSVYRAEAEILNDNQRCAIASGAFSLNHHQSGTTSVEET